VIVNVSAAGKKAPKRKRGRADDEADEEGGGEVASIDEWPLDHADRVTVEDAGLPFGTGLPRSDYVLSVSVPLSLDAPRTRRQYSDSVKPFPASIARFMLQAGVGGGLDLDGVDGSSYMILPAEAVNIVNGLKLADKRTLLAGGDASWAHAYLDCIKRLGADQRVVELTRFVRLGYALTETRMNGSNLFFCSRVAAYAKFMSDRPRSALECCKVLAAFLQSYPI
jgi:hypothetical protein